MRRRELVLLLAAVVAVKPTAAGAEQPTKAIIAYLSSKTATAEARVVNAIRRALGEAGFTEGRNLVLSYHWSEGDYDRLTKLAREIVGTKVDVILASSLPAALAAKAATTTIPIVFRLGVDPVEYGLANSLARPGGNITGVTMLHDMLTPKTLQLLHELVPDAAVVGLLLNRKNRNAEGHQQQVEAAAATLGISVLALTASAVHEIEPAFNAARQHNIRSILVGSDPVFDTYTERLVEEARRFAIPTMSYTRDFATVGGLISYGASFEEMAYQAGLYAGRILKGAKPAELPVMQPTKFELVINLKTAKTLGLTVPPALIARADEVIE